MARVVVIGAGVAGLSVAARLAKLRHDVTVLERSSAVGGQVGRLTRDGFSFDTGPTFLMLPAVYRDTFRKSGRPLERELELLPIDPSMSCRFPDGTRLDLPNASRGGRMAAFDAALGPGAGVEWERLIRRGEAIWQVVRQPILEASPTSWRDLRTTLARPHALRTLAPWSTLRRYGERHLSHPAARAVLEHHASYVGSDPRTAPAALALLTYVEQTFGSWYVVGGLHRLAAALHERVLLRKAIVRMNVEVEAVLVEGDRITGVRLSDGERLDADVVVAAMGAGWAVPKLLPAVLTVASTKSAHPERRVMSPSVFTLFLAVRGRTLGLGHRTVLFPAERDAELAQLFGPARRRRVGVDGSSSVDRGAAAGPGAPVMDPTITITVPDDPALRPDNDHEAWVVQVSAPLHRESGVERASTAPTPQSAGVDWADPKVAESYADRLLDLLAQHGLDVRPRLLWREFRTPYDIESETGSPGGSAYGIAWHGAGSLFHRPGNQPSVRGLYLVGAGAHPGGGLPWAGRSAATVANLIGPA